MSKQREFGEAAKVIPSQAPQECGEGVETRAWSPERTVKPHECAASHVDDEIVRHSVEKRRGRIKSLPITDADFGEHRIVPNRFSRDRTILVLDMDYWSVAWLDGWKKEKLGKTADAEQWLVTGECTLESRNEAASGKIADVLTV